MNKDSWIEKNGILITYLVCLTLIGVLCFSQGRWDGMRKLCPEPNIIGTNRTSFVCYDQDEWEELHKQEEVMNNYNLEEYLNGFET